MRVSFNIPNSKDVKEFFSQEIDFLDVYVTERALYLISNRTDTYSHLAFEVVSREDFTGPTSFRIDRKEFLSMLTDSVVSFYISPSGYIETFFRAGETMYSMRRPHQASDMSLISSKLSILKHQDKFSILRIRELSKYSSLLRSFNFINIYDGLLSTTKDNVSVFCKVECPNLNLSTQALNYILKFSDRIHGFQNFVIGRGEASVIIARQSRADFESDFEYLMSRKSSHRIKFDASNICYLARRCSTGSVVTLNFNREECLIDNENRRFQTKFKIHERVSARDQKSSIDIDDFDFSDTSVATETKLYPNLVFPINLFKDLLPTLQSRNNVTLLVKKRVVQMEVGKGLYIVSGRRESVNEL